MSGSLNKVSLIGKLGKDPEVRSFNNGGSVCNLSVATSESWKDKATGEKKERVEWNRVCIFNEHLIKIAESYLHKGDMVYIEGQLQTRKYEKDGRDVYTTEIVLSAYKGVLTILASTKKKDDDDAPARAGDPSAPAPATNDMDSPIPF